MTASISAPATASNADLAATLLRVTSGVWFVIHALVKIFVFTLPGTVGFFESIGLPGSLGYLTMLVEIAGGLALILGIKARIVSLALVRDVHSGPRMARIVSFAMMIFTLVPAIAPFIGQGIMALTGWRGIFLAFMAFSALTMLWFWLRQPETLAVADRRPLRLGTLVAAFREVLSYRVVVVSIAVPVLVFFSLQRFFVRGLLSGSVK